MIEIVPKEYKNFIKSIHPPILHITGILVTEKTLEKGIISAMINGVKNKTFLDGRLKIAIRLQSHTKKFVNQK